MDSERKPNPRTTSDEHTAINEGQYAEHSARTGSGKHTHPAVPRDRGSYHEPSGETENVGEEPAGISGEQAHKKPSADKK
jgi:hypothetical protein